MSRLAWCPLVAIAALVATLALGCSPVTQLLVVVRSDLPASDIVEVHIAVVAGEPFTSEPTTRQAVVGVGEGLVALPFSFGVLPRNGDPTSRVEIEVSAIDGRGEITVTRLVRTGFSEGRTLAVPVFLGAACRDRMCGEGLTCVDGACVSPEVPVEDLIPVRPGDELADAARPAPADAGVPSTVGFPEPTRQVTEFAGEFAFVRRIVPLAGGELIVVADTSDRPVFGIADTQRGGPTTVVVRLSAELSPLWHHATEGSLSSSAAAVSGDRVFVCGSYDGTLAPDALAALPSSNDGFDDSNDAAFLLELDLLTGAPRAIHPIASGVDVVCDDLAVSRDTLGVSLLVRDTTEVTFDGAPVVLEGCALPDAVLLRVNVSSGVTSPISSPTFNQISGSMALDPDEAGGFFVAVGSRSTGQENTNRSCGAGGAPTSLEALHIDGAGTVVWGRTLLEIPETVTIAMDDRVVRTGDRVVTLAVLETLDLPYSVADALGGSIAPSAAAPRVVWTSVRATDGNDPRSVASIASVRAISLAGREPDVVFCGITPHEGIRPGFLSGLFGVTPPTSEASGYMIAIGPTGLPTWSEFAVGDQGWVSACTSDGRGGVLASATFLNAPGTFRGEMFQGSLLVHLEP